MVWHAPSPWSVAADRTGVAGSTCLQVDGLSVCGKRRPLVFQVPAGSEPRLGDGHAGSFVDAKKRRPRLRNLRFALSSARLQTSSMIETGALSPRRLIFLMIRV